MKAWLTILIRLLFVVFGTISFLAKDGLYANAKTLALPRNCLLPLVQLVAGTRDSDGCIGECRRSYRGPLVWNLGTKVRRKDVEALVVPLFEDVIRSSDANALVNNGIYRNIVRFWRRELKTDIKSIQKAQIEAALQTLKKEVRELPIGEGNFLLPIERNSVKRETRKIVLAELDYIFFMKVKKTIALRQVDSGEFQIALSHDDTTQGAFSDPLFAEKWPWWQRRPWQKSSPPQFRYPASYRLDLAETTPVSVEDLLVQLERSLQPFFQGKESEVPKWRHQLFFDLNENFVPMMEWWLDMPRQWRDQVDRSKLLEWGANQQLLLGQENLKTYLTTQLGFAEQVAASLTKSIPQMWPTTTLGGSLRIGGFQNQGLTLHFYMSFPQSNAAWIAGLQKGEPVKLQPSIHIRIEPNWNLSPKQSISKRELRAILLAISEFGKQLATDPASPPH